MRVQSRVRSDKSGQCSFFGLFSSDQDKHDDEPEECASYGHVGLDEGVSCRFFDEETDEIEGDGGASKRVCIGKAVAEALRRFSVGCGDLAFLLLSFLKLCRCYVGPLLNALQAVLEVVFNRINFGFGPPDNLFGRFYRVEIFGHLSIVYANTLERFGNRLVGVILKQDFMPQGEGNRNQLDTEVQYLKGVGPKVAMLLKKLKLETVRDVLEYFPRRYEDRRNLPPIMMAKPGNQCTVRGRLLDVTSRGTRGGKVMIRAIVADDTGQIDLVWFNQPWIGRDLQKVEGEIIAFGTVKEGRGGGREMSSPEWEPVEDDDDSEDFARIHPVYSLVDGVPQWAVRRAAGSAIEFFASMAEEPLPEDLRKSFRLKGIGWCLKQMHQPDSLASMELARRRLVFEEFLYLQLMLQMQRMQVKQEIGISFPLSKVSGAGDAAVGLFGEGTTVSGSLWEQVAEMLPFELTGAQKRVVREIWNDMERPYPMNRLVQGDVGSGKTAVAACAMLGAVRCGYQAALMAPTEILAEQHYAGLKKLFEPVGVEIVLLVGKQGSREKKKALELTAGGQAHVAVGTHALIQEGVKFHKLGLAVIDEQHRFGVVQRMALRQKGVGNPDVLVMTATPIPRTMTMSLYGDLDLSVIDELPPGRKAIRTHWKSADKRRSVYETVKGLIEEGRQAYFVCPMITESEKMQTQAAEDLYYRLKEQVYPELRVGLLHGQMKGVEKESVMDAFRAGDLDILVSTVVIEVGVDVPNATVMVIEDANRFGLSQLHQLRGRVGRGEHQSFCILIANATTKESEQRLKIMVETTDGFRIAEEDLKIRGPGDVAGTRQSGALDFKVANLVDDGPVLEEARLAALEVLQVDPGLTFAEHRLMLDRVKARRSEQALIVVS